MYQIYKEILSNCIIRMFVQCGSFKNPIIKYLDGIPYIFDGDDIIAIESRGNYYANNCITQMLKLFDVYECSSKYDSDSYDIYFEVAQNSLQMIGNMGVHNWQGNLGGWILYTLDGMPMHEIVDGKLDRLLLLFVIDPLAFISRMRHQIDRSSLGVQQFFSVIETSINSKMQRYVIKYSLIGQLKDRGIINDVSLFIADIWVQLEICDLVKIENATL